MLLRDALATFWAATLFAFSGKKGAQLRPSKWVVPDRTGVSVPGALKVTGEATARVDPAAGGPCAYARTSSM